SAQWAAALAIVYATIDGAPDIFGSLIWQTGMMAYVIPLILTSAWCAAYLSRQPEQISWLDAVIPFVAAGFSELFAICATAFFPPMSPRRLLRFACAVTLASTAAAQFITPATLSAPPPARSLIVPHFFIVLAVAILGAAAGTRIPRRALAFALVAAIAGGPLVSAYRNVRIVSSERAFAQEWDALDAAL